MNYVTKILDEKNIEWEKSGNYVVMNCPFCEKKISGNLIATFNIDESGYGNCSACNIVIDWKGILEKLGITIKVEEVIKKEEKKVTEWTHNKTLTPKKTKGHAITRCFSDIESVQINWLWEGRIALGKLTMIAGDPGFGKSLLTATLATHVSKGLPFPVDNFTPPIGDIILLSAEDDPADTIKPRLEALEADCKHIYIIEAIQDIDDNGESTQHTFSLKRDLEAIENLLFTLPNCRLVVIDPVSAYLDGTDSNSNSDIRGLFAPLAELASRHKVAIVLVSHLNKNSGGGNAGYRVMGSLAFTAAVRSAYIVTKDNNNPERRLLMPLKNNLAKDCAGLAYSVITAENGAPLIVWESEPVTITADEALSMFSLNREPNETDEATDLLLKLLSNGPIKVSDGKKEARSAGISEKSLRRAREKLGVKSNKSDFSGGWEWSLSQHAQHAHSQEKGSLGIFDNNGVDNF